MSLRILLALVLISQSCLAGPRGQPEQQGIGNFGRINDNLYRGAQPDAAGIQSLRRLGVKLILNLRMPKDVWPGEEAAARANGIAYTNLPMSGLGRPADDAIKNILSIIESSGGPVFVHCEHGCDRTGTVIACYRIEHDKWSGGRALQEAALYGMSKLERGMKQYVSAFAKARSGEAATASASEKTASRAAESKAE